MVTNTELHTFSDIKELREGSFEPLKPNEILSVSKEVEPLKALQDELRKLDYKKVA